MGQHVTEPIPAHPAAELFPPMDSEEFERLVSDIKERGQLVPIITHEGAILDGLNRYRACVRLGIEPVTKEWDGKGDPVRFVVSMNLSRRHLTPAQRAMIAARIANMGNGTNQYQQVGTGIPVPTAAQMLNVNKDSVSEAKTVLRYGTDEEIKAVDSGDAAVSTTARKIRDRKAGIESAPSTSPLGDKLPIPEGKTAESLCREGIAFEPELQSRDIARRLGVGEQSYRKMRDIVRIADRADLSPRHKAIAARALADMNTSSRVGRPYDLVKPIAELLWGNGKGPSRDGLEANRLAAFERAFGTIIQVCSSAAEIEIPHLPPERAAAALVELREATRGVRELDRKIGGIIQ